MSERRRRRYACFGPLLAARPRDGTPTIAWPHAPQKKLGGRERTWRAWVLVRQAGASRGKKMHPLFSSQFSLSLSLFLTVLERVQALVRDLDLDGRVEGGRVVQDAHGRHVDGRHG